MNTMIDRSKYTIITAVDGHVKSVGREAGKEKNQLWKVIDNKTTKELVLHRPKRKMRANKIAGFRRLALLHTRRRAAVPSPKN